MGEWRKLNQFVYALFTQRKKKALAIARKCLIFNVDQLGLEICRALRDPPTERKKPMTSRL